MFERAAPRFEWGQRVEAALDLFNDGSFPGAEAGALLVGQGTRGEVVRVGLHVEDREAVYLVDFGRGRVVGCRDKEIALLAAPEGESSDAGGNR